MSYISRETKKDDNQLAVQEDDDDPIFDQNPVKVSCPHCGLNVITFIEHEASWVTYAVCIGLLLVLNWAAICVVPVVYPLFKDVVHHCPRCLSVLATRSRVVLPKLKDDVMSFRFGSCVVVLARKYVIALTVLVTFIIGIHWMRSSGAPPTHLDLVTRGPSVQLTWEDFTRDCGFKSYLGNPIHVSVAFDENYKNKTVHWAGRVHRVEEGLSLLWLHQRGAVFVRMQPPQFPSKRDMADLVLLYKDTDQAVAEQVSKLKRGGGFAFDATMVDVGKRGAPHVLALWEVRPLDDDQLAAALSASVAASRGSAGGQNASLPGGAV